MPASLRRQEACGDCYLYPSGSEGFLPPDKRGWAYNDAFYRSYATYIEKGKIEKDVTLGEFHKLSLIKELGMLICTPYISSEGAITLTDWAVSSEGLWQSTGHLDGLVDGYTTYRVMQLNSTGFNSALSVFTVPEGGSWSFVIRRSTPKSTEKIEECATWIEFDKYCLYIPYNGGIGLYKQSEGAWQRVADVVLPTNNSVINDEGSNVIVVSMLNVDGMILLSGDFFKNYFVYRENDDIIPKDYRVKVAHKGSAWQFNFYTTKFKAGTLFSTDIPVYYKTDLNYSFSTMGERLAPGTSTLVQDDPVTPSTDDKVRYKLTMTPSVVEGKNFYRTPAVTGVLVKHKPVVEQENQLPVNLAAPYDIDNGGGSRLLSINGDEGIDFDTSAWSIVLDNEDARLSDPADAYFVKPYRIMKLRGGYKTSAGVRTVKTLFTGVTLTPTFGSYQNMRSTVNLRLANLAYLCSKTFCKGDWPIFDDWVIREALEWLALRCRIKEDRHDFYVQYVDPEDPESGEDPDSPILQRLSKGTPEDPLWQASVLQTSAWEMMKKIADYIKYDLFFDREGTLVCQPKQFGWDGTYDHHFFVSEDASISSADLQTFNVATDVEVSMQGEDWYNVIYVGGFQQGGGVISTYLEDTDSIYNSADEHYMGFEKAVAVTYETATSKEKTQEIASGIYYDFLQYPIKVAFLTFFNPDIVPNQIVKLSGSKHKVIGGIGDDARYYRIINLGHNLDMKGLSTTNVVGEFVGTHADALVLLGA